MACGGTFSENNIGAPKIRNNFLVHYQLQKQNIVPYRVMALPTYR